jgi:hypothetical protein
MSLNLDASPAIKKPAAKKLSICKRQSSPTMSKYSRLTCDKAIRYTIVTFYARMTKTNMDSFDKSTLLTVIVGKAPNQEDFSVHEGIICTRSEFFRRAMNGNWAESEERVVKLPDDDPEIFAAYINLVYTNNVATNETKEPKTTDQLSDEHIVLAKLYVLSEKLCDKAAKNAAINIVYSGTPKNAPGR